MQFKNPEIFYLFFLLIIPILVHLFQLQKFVKVAFTNVAFLQQIVQQNRRSSRIKKWLILTCRLLLFSSILFAFSQPYFSNKEFSKKQHNFIYLDNSLSTGATGEKGKLLQVAAQEIINSASASNTYTLQTNTNFYKNLSKEELKEVLLDIKNTSKSIDFKSIYLKISEPIPHKTKTLTNNIYISDFQNKKHLEFTNVTPPFSIIQLKPSIKNNISIDSVFVSDKKNNTTTVKAVIKNQGDAKYNIPIALHNKTKLISKQSFSIQKDSNQIIEFKLQNQSEFNGKISITFSDTFTFDNSFFFTLKKPKKINVLIIGNNAEYLKKIYPKEEFNYSFSSLQNTNYNSISNQNLIVLSELKSIPKILSNRLYEFAKNGGNIVLIPSSKIDTNSYNNFLTKLNIGVVKNQLKNNLKITEINFNHPLLKNVFVKKVTNFQYPTVNSYLSFDTSLGYQILTFENNLPFIQEFSISNGKLFLVASNLDKENSNFTNSPLIVPIFYNFAQSSFNSSTIFYRTNTKNTIDVEVKMNKDDVLSIANTKNKFIPLQRQYQKKTSLITDNQLKKNGFYYILKNKDTLETIAFNYPKSESNLNFMDVAAIRNTNKNINISDSIASFFNQLNKKNEVHWLWKWFLSLAIVSLLLEILILKFYKT
ncbi:BatA domain-containing protein [uncultured Polaribacter sp.]|uniref:BatA domain-containing protein n=1 Tax=uncultured Polaribacter sp. TaxID=174711 RepID=UPI00262E4A3D|nr:BatA domain-containing protein [uncultured Polaribacter sp.]